MPQLAQASRDDFWLGHRMIWRHVPRGGYGFAVLIPVTVVRRTNRRVWVKIETSGEEVSVKPTSLWAGDMRSDPAWTLGFPRPE